MPLDELRGMEAARMRAAYGLVAKRFGVEWKKRSFNRQQPLDGDEENQAVNHAATSVYACATVATYAVGAIPQLGFLHEDSGLAFVLDVADMFRTTHTLPIAFGGLADFRAERAVTLERAVRERAAKEFSKASLVTSMITAIKALFPCP
jgi:CRISPR-associated protein Cas1